MRERGKEGGKDLEEVKKREREGGKKEGGVDNVIFCFYMYIHVHVQKVSV